MSNQYKKNQLLQRQLDLSSTSKIEDSSALAQNINDPDYITVQEQQVFDYNHCDLCGNELLFTHNTHFCDLVVNEDAFCASCNIKSKSIEHVLQ